MSYRNLSDLRTSDSEDRGVPSFIEPLPPLISNPFMRPRPQKGTNLLEKFEEDSELEEPELVQVFLRVKPCDVPSSLYKIHSENCLITSLDTATVGHGRRTQHNVSKMYTFSHIFGPESQQKEIFDHVVKDNLKKLPDGHNFILLTYGASGSGKTYTLMGTVNAPGVVPRSLEFLFKIVDAAQNPVYKPSDSGSDKLSSYNQELELQWVKSLRQVSAPLRDKYRRMSKQLCKDMTVSSLDYTNRARHYIWVSFIEIYNESIYDLLVNCDRRTTSKLRIREDANGNVYVKGATQAFVRTGQEAYDVMVAGKHNLQVAATGIHAQSSRSHCIFTITLLTETENGVRTSTVRLCDLAGSERASRTKNTGARMQESRAINSSLHVLERCLHMLRRKQAKRLDSNLVPYRESKLTRLLGAGLTGARGSSVSMLVTLTPAPQYANETRHVLQLAAVATDIQVNNTIAEMSSLESSAQESTFSYNNGETMRLRAENERLHFEVIQAQAHIKELNAMMEEKQQSAFSTMRELVDEAKDMTRQYYEAQINALEERHKLDIEELTVEYESKLVIKEKPTSVETPTKYRDLQKKCEQLVTDNAILLEQLNFQRLARARLEEEVRRHLRACIHEQDEKAESDKSINDVIPLFDSDPESEDEVDPLNESLEPTFKKEDINRSKLRLSLHNQTPVRVKNDIDIKELNESVLEKSTNTLKDDSFPDDASNESDLTAKEDDNEKDESINSSHITNFNTTIAKIESIEIQKSPVHIEENKPLENDSIQDMVAKNDARMQSDANQKVDTKLDDTQPLDKNHSMSFTTLKSVPFNVSSHSSNSRETYSMVNLEDVNITNTNDSLSKHPDKNTHNCRETYFVNNVEPDICDKSKNMNAPDINESVDAVDSKCINYTNNNCSDLNLSEKSGINSKDIECINTVKLSIVDVPKNNGTSETNEKVKDELKSNVVISLHATFSEKAKAISSIIKTDLKSVEDNTVEDKNRNEKEVTEKDPFKILTLDENNELKMGKCLNNFTPETKPEKLPKLIEDIKCNSQKIKMQEILLLRQAKSINSTPETDCSLVQFEQLEQAANVFDVNSKKEPIELIPAVKPAAVKKYFESVEDDVPIIVKGKRNYFGSVTNDKSVLNNDTCNNINGMKHEDERSPSIVKDEIPKDYEPSTIKKLLGESFTKSTDTVLTSKEIIMPRKHDSVDVFDGYDSPLLKVKTKEGMELIASACKSIEKLVLDQNERGTEKNYQEDKNERASVFDFVKPKDKANRIDTENDVCNSTIDDFENLYKNTTARATEFDLLVTHDINSNVKENTTQNDSQELFVDKPKSKKGAKYNLRHKNQNDLKKDTEVEILLESQSKCESKQTKRSLRLRRRKKGEDCVEEVDNVKLKDIVNLQEEFSDVTMDVPVIHKPVNDIPSPEKPAGHEENLPPYEIQSCPSKSVTRSRRKLFTPRAEPLEESPTGTGDSNERIRVPRPSYHRTRVRRKLFKLWL